MPKLVSFYGQYKNDFFNKLNFNFKKGKKILDVECGDRTDGEIFIKEFKLKFYGIDIYKAQNLNNQKFNFRMGSIYKIPFNKDTFDYVFTHDVLHHIDEKGQRRQKHIHGLKELRRVCKKGGTIIIIEGNRYNPLFYPHMVIMRGHQHFKQSYFKEIIQEVFQKDKVNFRFFEAHLYPKTLVYFFKIFEYFMEHFSPKQFLAYNVAEIVKR
jgi:ubiquinone/menaquinone biosynthesis C-methylase UbiE